MSAHPTVAIRKQVKKINQRYPLKRGVIGHLAYWFGMVYTRLGVELSAEGRKNIPQRTPYVIAANHETFVDGMWIGSFLPHHHFPKFSCIAAKDLENRYGLLGKLIVKVGRAIAIDRFGNPIRGLLLAIKKVEEGNILLIHPEGTRSKDGRLGEFKEGAAFISIKCNVPLVPVFIDGGYEVFGRHLKLPQLRDRLTRKKRKLRLVYGPPMLPANYANADVMTEALTAWMKDQFANKKVPREFVVPPVSDPVPTD